MELVICKQEPGKETRAGTGNLAVCMWGCYPKSYQLNTGHGKPMGDSFKKVPGLACLDEAVFQPQEILSNGVLALRPLHLPKHISKAESLPGPKTQSGTDS